MWHISLEFHEWVNFILFIFSLITFHIGFIANSSKMYSFLCVFLALLFCASVLVPENLETSSFLFTSYCKFCSWGDSRCRSLMDSTLLPVGCLRYPPSAVTAPLKQDWYGEIKKNKYEEHTKENNTKINTEKIIFKMHLNV